MFDREMFDKEEAVADLNQALGIDLGAVCDVLERNSAETEQVGALTDEAWTAMSEARLFHALVPEALGGAELLPRQVLALGEVLSYHSGSAGWVFSQNAGVMAHTAFLAPHCAKEVAAGTNAAGVYAPHGVAEQVDGGYKVSGAYQYASGSTRAAYIGSGALIMVDGEIAPANELGNYPVCCYLLPSENVERIGNWDVMGLQGTGSVDYRVDEQFVEQGMTFSLFETNPITGGPLYRIGPVPLTTIGACGWALGVASRAMHELFEIVKAGRTRLGQDPMADQQIFQREFGRHTMALDAARMAIHQAHQNAYDQADRTGEVSIRAMVDIKAASNYLFGVAREVTRFAFEQAGSQGFRNPSRVQQCFRDMFTGGLHIAFADRYLNDLTNHLLGREVSPI